MTAMRFLDNKNTDMIPVTNSIEQKSSKTRKEKTNQTTCLFPRLSKSTPLCSSKFTERNQITNLTKSRTEFPEIAENEVKRYSSQSHKDSGLFLKKNRGNNNMPSKGQIQEAQDKIGASFLPMLIPLSRKPNGRICNDVNHRKKEYTKTHIEDGNIHLQQENKNGSENRTLKEAPSSILGKKGNQLKSNNNRAMHRKWKLLEKKLHSCIQKSTDMDQAKDIYQTCLPYSFETNKTKFKIIETNRSNQQITSDQLLLKLTKTLPKRLLLKTDQTLQDLGSALGFDDRRNNLLVIEHNASDQSPLDDQRFKKLMVSLEKHDEEKN